MFPFRPGGPRSILGPAALLLAALTPFGAVAQGQAPFDSGQRFGNAHSRDVAVADLDGDGDVDVFVANSELLQPGGNRIWINQGGAQDGDGATFAAGPPLNSGQSEAVALGDLDGDGDSDAFVGNLFGNGDAANRVWFNAGDGSFQPGTQALGDRNTFDVALADLDGDGDLDAAVANSEAGDANMLWINEGGDQGGIAGTFIAGSALGSAQAASVVLSDVDGDGDPDAVLGVWFGSPPANEVWINQGGAQGGTPGAFVDSGQRLGSRRTLGLRAADFDGDGDVDLFAANSGIDAADVVWINQGGAQQGTVGAFAPGHTGPSRPSSDAAVGDFDADGDADLMVTHFNQQSGRANAVWLNDGSAGFIDAGAALGSNGSQAAAPADLDGDGDLDVVVANDGSSAGSESNRVWLNGAPAAPAGDADLSLSATPSGSVDVQLDNGLSPLSARVVLRVENRGPDRADNVGLEIFATLPGASSSKMTCSERVDRELCEITALADGEPADATWSVLSGQQHNTGIYVGTLSMSARVTAETKDTNVGDNSASTTFDFYDCLTTCFIESLFCNSNFGAPSGRGKSTAFVPDLPLYYLVRRKMNHGAEGRRLVDLYNEHDAELVALVTGDALLLEESLNVLAAWEPHLRELVGGDPDAAVISSPEIVLLDDLLTRLAQAGSAELAAAIAAERAAMGPLSDLAGQTVAQAAARLIPSDVIFEAGFERPETLTD